MTWHPEALGDEGQRYEIRATNKEGEEFVVGWAEKPDAFKKAIELHPSWTGRRVIDRRRTE